MRNLWHSQYLRAIYPVLTRRLIRYRPPFQILGYSAFTLKAGQNPYRSEFARSYQSSPPCHSTENGSSAVLQEISDTHAQATSHVEVLSSRVVESNERSENPTASPNPLLSLEIAWNKITDSIEAEFAHIGGIRHKPTALINNIAGCGAINLEEDLIIFGESRFRCGLKCHSSDYDITISVAGESDSKVRAKRAAYLFLISELHERGLLTRIFESANGKPLVGRDLLVQEEMGLKDVYNYAARFGYVPKVTARPFAGGRSGEDPRVEVTIELPQQNIKAAAIGRRFKLAQAAAVVRFKRQAEVYHADNESTLSTVNRAAALSTQNVDKFGEFCDIHHGEIILKLDIKEIGLPGTKSYFQAVVLVDGEEIASPAYHFNRKEASTLASLATGVTLLANDPTLERGFSKTLKVGNGKVLEPAQVDTTVVEEDCLIAMQDTIREMRKIGFHNNTEQYQPDMEPLEDRRRNRRSELTGENAKRKSRELSSKLKSFKDDLRHENLRSKLQNLPMYQYRNKVLDIVQNNNYSVIIGATGSGKTTQVPQIVLNHAVEEGYGAHCNIICTQPRRIAASSVARRVSKERGQELRDSVGYHVRFDAKLPKMGGSITYSTTGILLVQLQNAPDEMFDSVSHIIIDEIHERDVKVDFLLILLKNIVKRRQQANQSVPKIVLMSATIDADLFTDYFQNESSDGALTRCPTLNVPGRTFPVKEMYLEDIVQQFSAAYEPEELQPFLSERATAAYLDSIEAEHQSRPEDMDATRQGDDGNFEASSIDWDNIHARPPSSQQASIVHEEVSLTPIGLACATIAHIARTSQKGAILVFLPGLNEIDTVQKMLMEKPRLGVDFSNTNDYRIFKLHSSIPATEKDVFEPLPGRCRKIILSTNIAETSVTIPDVQYVVDSGKLREKIYDQSRRFSKLACGWFSKSNAKQRAGRAGRVQNGNYYALYTRQKFNSLRAVGVPEILRIDLQEVCLRVKSQSFQTPVREFLAQALEPPSLAQVDASVRNLQALEALDQDEEITALGRLLAQLPTHPSLGKMIVLGIVFRCLDPMIVMGAIGGERSLWVSASSSQERSAASQARLDYMGQSNSEHIGTLNAFKDARQVFYKSGKDAAYEHCVSKFIKFISFRGTLRATHQIREILEEARLIPAGKKDGFELGGPDLNVNSSCIPLIKALLTSGMFPNMAISTSPGRAFRTERGGKSRLHPRSSLEKKLFVDEKPYLGKLVVFSSQQKLISGQQMFLADVGQITPLMAMLFGGRLSGKGDIVTMDSWLRFDIRAPKSSGDIPYKPAKMIIEFRKALDKVLTVAFRDLSKFENPRNLGSRKHHSPSSEYLADDPVRVMFAERFVEVLLLELNPKKESSYPPKEMHTSLKGLYESDIFSRYL